MRVSQTRFTSFISSDPTPLSFLRRGEKKVGHWRVTTFRAIIPGGLWPSTVPRQSKQSQSSPSLGNIHVNTLLTPGRNSELPHDSRFIIALLLPQVSPAMLRISCLST